MIKYSIEHLLINFPPQDRVWVALDGADPADFITKLFQGVDCVKTSGSLQKLSCYHLRISILVDVKKLLVNNYYSLFSVRKQLLLLPSVYWLQMFFYTWNRI